MLNEIRQLRQLLLLHAFDDVFRTCIQTGGRAHGGKWHLLRLCRDQLEAFREHSSSIKPYSWRG
jgi:hypothetical protein